MKDSSLRRLVNDLSKKSIIFLKREYNDDEEGNSIKSVRKSLEIASYLEPGAMTEGPDVRNSTLEQKYVMNKFWWNVYESVGYGMNERRMSSLVNNPQSILLYLTNLSTVFLEPDNILRSTVRNEKLYNEMKFILEDKVPELTISRKYL